jgi:hypothetical protein
MAPKRSASTSPELSATSSDARSDLRPPPPPPPPAPGKLGELQALTPRGGSKRLWQPAPTR